MGLWGRNPDPGGSLWREAPGRAATQSAREARNDRIVAQKREEMAHAERARLREDRRAERSGRGSYKHPAHEKKAGHKDPRRMTQRELKAHGLIVERGFFGQVVGIKSRRSAIMAAHDAAQDAHDAKRSYQDAKRALAKAAGNRKVPAKVVRQLSLQAAAAKTRHVKAKQNAHRHHKGLR